MAGSLPDSLPSLGLLSSLIAIVYVVFRLARFGSREKCSPPGPPTFPIVCNAHLAVDRDLYKRLNNLCFGIAVSL